ncbi:MAG: tripartite tricarboxylate transporter substrate binding protein [Hyphomicrobiales bacterium]|nr:tripartite tricarboxylate transporter substrate binding protein [Hyphomicrobiales bacterium]
MAKLATSLIAWLVALLGVSQAQDWPNRPVRIVNTFAAGGASDILARMIADHMTAVFKQQFFVETRGGAGGVVGVQTVAHAPPDGYNFVITTLGLTTLIPIATPKVGYDPLKNLTHISYIGGSPVVFVTGAKSQFKNLKDFVERARRGPKPLTFGSSGPLTVGPMLARSLERMAKITFDIVPYKGASQSLLDVIANHIDFATASVTSAAAQIRAGAVLGLAHSGPARLADYPDIPTFKESGFDLVELSWFGLAGPANLSPEIVVRVNREVAAAMRRPENEKRLRQDAMITQTMTPADFTAFIQQENARWTPVLEEIGLIQR